MRQKQQEMVAVSLWSTRRWRPNCSRPGPQLQGCRSPRPQDDWVDWASSNAAAGKGEGRGRTTRPVLARPARTVWDSFHESTRVATMRERGLFGASNRQRSVAWCEPCFRCRTCIHVTRISIHERRRGVTRTGADVSPSDVVTGGSDVCQVSGILWASLMYLMSLPLQLVALPLRKGKGRKEKERHWSGLCIYLLVWTF